MHSVTYEQWEMEGENMSTQAAQYSLLLKLTRASCLSGRWLQLIYFMRTLGTGV